MPRLPDAVRELALPLRHEDIIRQQSTAKGVDPSLVAAVIYAESKFRDQTSHAGARGLMQITPETARYIARLSGGTAFEQGDLATPQVNISYGVYYLRYLLRRYGDNKVLALAAYNGGEGNVDRWIARGGDVRARVRRRRRSRSPRRASTSAGCSTRRRDYRRKYRRELGPVVARQQRVRARWRPGLLARISSSGRSRSSRRQRGRRQRGGRLCVAARARRGGMRGGGDAAPRGVPCPMRSRSSGEATCGRTPGASSKRSASWKRSR